MDIIIRQESESDFRAVEDVVTLAFKGADHSDGNEASLVRALRISGSFIPELSLVAVVEGMIVGYILLTKVGIGSGTGVALAPLAVLPSFQRMGIGTVLVSRGHEEAKRMGFSVSVVLGSPDYYMRHGYKPADAYCVYPPFDVASEYYMVCVLDRCRTVPRGVVRYDSAFGI